MPPVSRWKAIDAPCPSTNPHDENNSMHNFEPRQRLCKVLLVCIPPLQFLASIH